MRSTKCTKTSLSLLRTSGIVPMQSFELGPRGHTLWQEMSEFTNEVPVKIQDAKVRLQHEEKKGARSEAQQCIMRSSLTCKILIGLADSDKSEVPQEIQIARQKACWFVSGVLYRFAGRLLPCWQHVFANHASPAKQKVSANDANGCTRRKKKKVSHLQLCKKLAFRRSRHQPASKSFHIKLEADSARPSSKPVTTFHEVERWNQMKPDETRFKAFGSFCAASVFCTVMIFEKISHWVMRWRHEDLEARSPEASKLKLLWTLRCDKCDPCLDNSIPNVICNLRYTIDTYWYPVTMSSRHHVTGVSYFQTQSLSDLQRLEHSPTSWKPPGGAEYAFAIPSKGT